MAAPVALSLAVGLLVGRLAQWNRFCTVGALCDLVMFKDLRLFNGIFSIHSYGFHHEPVSWTVQARF